MSRWRHSARWRRTRHAAHRGAQTLEDAKGRELSRNTYWRYREADALRGLNKAEQVKLTGGITQVSRSGDRHELTAVIRNQGSSVAAMVRLSLLEDAHGRRVLPTLYSDNYLWLLPGESRTVQLSWSAEACSSRHPALTAEAYNSPVATLRG
ncbi:glycoside hydrolase family 2 protein [Streptomyces kaempferi]